MFRKLVKNKKAQNTAEYAILISLVVAGIIAMQTYAQRALQARVRDAAAYLTNTTKQLGNTVQYEPYYLLTNYQVTTNEFEKELQGQKIGVAGIEGVVRFETNTVRTRAQDGKQVSTYDTALQGIKSGL